MCCAEISAMCCTHRTPGVRPKLQPRARCYPHKLTCRTTHTQRHILYAWILRQKIKKNAFRIKLLCTMKVHKNAFPPSKRTNPWRKDFVPSDTVMHSAISRWFFYSIFKRIINRTTNKSWHHAGSVIVCISSLARYSLKKYKLVHSLLNAEDMF